MPFQSEAIRTKCIFPCFSSIREKFSEGMLTYITGHRISLVKNGQYPKKKVGHQLQVLSWNISDDKTDDGFHEGVILKWFVKIFPE